MTAVSAQRTAERMLEAVGAAVLAQTKRNLQSMGSDRRQAQALRDDLRVGVLQSTEEMSKMEISTDYYWAIYYHDGRGPIRARPGKFLVFYRNPDDDPRHDGAARNYPRRASEVRELNLPRSEFLRLLRSGALIATKRVGPAGSHPFFERGFAAAAERAGPRVLGLLRKYVRELLREADVWDVDETFRVGL